MRRLAPIALFIGAGFGCGGSEEPTVQADAGREDPGPVDTATSGDDVATTETSPPADTAVDPFGPYPAGPYGNKLGDVVANLAWEGYVSPLADALANTRPYVTTSMDQLRRDARKGYALVHVSEFY